LGRDPGSLSRDHWMTDDDAKSKAELAKLGIVRRHRVQRHPDHPGSPKAAVASVGARGVAVSVLQAVFGEGAFTAQVLDTELSRLPDLDPRDRALATELCYGVLRTWRVLERRLLEFAQRGIGVGADRVRIELLVAAYQLLLLDRVPAFAVVHDTVERVGSYTNRQVSGFVNALLRRLAAGPKLTADQAIEESAPQWLFWELVRTLGREQALFVLGANSGPVVEGEARVRREIVPTCVRLRPGVSEPDWLQDKERGQLFAPAYRLFRAGNLQRYPEFGRGEFVQQEEGAMFCGAALGVRPGERVLDACAGRGQKASYLAEQLAGTGELWVADRTGKKLNQLEAEFERLGLPKPNVRALDWSTSVTDIPAQFFDRILVDAPCSGSGTLRHRPEIGLRLEPRDPDRLAKLAEQILRNVCAHVRPGGRVVFVVCSVLGREAEAVVERVQDLYAECAFDAAECPALEGLSRFRVLPGVHGTDGYFLASLTPRPVASVDAG
jgi:16S rRNA (cytosine967-C5)-methyltransferase